MTPMNWREKAKEIAGLCGDSNATTGHWYSSEKLIAEFATALQSAEESGYARGKTEFPSDVVETLKFYADMKFNREKGEWMPSGPDHARACLKKLGLCD